MPWKLILVILFIGILIALVGFNWSYTSNVSFGFYSFENVPIILTIGISFLAGALFAIPYSVRTTLRIRKKQAKKKGSASDAEEKELVKKIEKSKKAKTSRKNRNTAQPLPDVPPEDSRDAKKS